ncbi:hypothetical protein ACSVDE_19170 [Pseudalkalibacillus sp. Hm43]|uniref:hypothetical protein n=1 Tax=Pseudalkalibacillus sp. Hm43 TaxID=3450742 RepID=UPI003F42D438
MNRKFWSILMSIVMCSALILSGCSEDTSNDANGDQDQDTQTDESAQLNEGKVQASLLEFQDKVTSTINQYDDDFKQFAQSVQSETENLSEEELKTLKNEAAQSSEQLATDLRNLEIPKELEAYSEELNQSLNGLADKFEQRSEDLNTEDVQQALKKAESATEEFYQNFESGLASIYEKLGLETPSFLNETQ